MKPTVRLLPTAHQPHTIAVHPAELQIRCRVCGVHEDEHHHLMLEHAGLLCEVCCWFFGATIGRVLWD